MKAAIARGLGRAPSQSEFVSLAGITDYHVLRFFPSWDKAVRDAGLHPYTLNVRREDSALLEDWAETVPTALRDTRPAHLSARGEI